MPNDEATFFYQPPVFAIVNNEKPEPEPEDYFPLVGAATKDGRRIPYIFRTAEAAHRCLQETPMFREFCDVCHIDDPFQFIGLLQAAIENNCRGVAIDPVAGAETARVFPIEELIRNVEQYITKQN